MDYWKVENKNNILTFTFVLECPSFLGKLSKGFGNVCFRNRNCYDISCAIPLPYANQRVMTTVDMKIDNCLKQLTISTQSTTAVVEFANGLYYCR